MCDFVSPFEDDEHDDEQKMNKPRKYNETIISDA